MNKTIYFYHLEKLIERKTIFFYTVMKNSSRFKEESDKQSKRKFNIEFLKN